MGVASIHISTAATNVDAIITPLQLYSRHISRPREFDGQLKLSRCDVLLLDSMSHTAYIYLSTYSVISSKSVDVQLFDQCNIIV